MKIMEDLSYIKQQIETIMKRNARVEKDKAWETSIFRKISIALLTYFVIVLFFFVADINRPFINAIVPTLWFLLSTLSLWFLKTIWLRYHK